MDAAVAEMKGELDALRAQVQELAAARAELARRLEITEPTLRRDVDRLRSLAAALEALAQEPSESRAYVDTGPVAERALAAPAVAYIPQSVSRAELRHAVQEHTGGKDGE